MDEDATQGDLDLESRALCPDEACIGVIGPDGRCAECGLPAGAEAAPIEARRDSGASWDQDEDQEQNENQDESQDQDDRRLCPDGDCIGVLGRDGRCKVCGAAA